jgi:hypothetical protein
MNAVNVAAHVRWKRKSVITNTVTVHRAVAMKTTKRCPRSSLPSLGSRSRTAQPAETRGDLHCWQRHAELVE